MSSPQFDMPFLGLRGEQKTGFVFFAIIFGFLTFIFVPYGSDQFVQFYGAINARVPKGTRFEGWAVIGTQPARDTYWLVYLGQLAAAVGLARLIAGRTDPRLPKEKASPPKPESEATAITATPLPHEIRWVETAPKNWPGKHQWP